MENEQVRLWRNFFLRLFLFSSLFAVFIFVTTELSKDVMMRALNIDETEFRRTVMNSLMLLRAWLFFVVLPAAVAFHSMLRRKT